MWVINWNEFDLVCKVKLSSGIISFKILIVARLLYFVFSYGKYLEIMCRNEEKESERV